MVKIISLPIEYRGKEFYTLIRVRAKSECTEFKVTIMNGELEQALYGSNILEYRDGHLHCHAAPGHEQGQILRQAVESALQQYLAIHPLNTATM